VTLLQEYEAGCAAYLEKIRDDLGAFAQKDAFTNVLSGAQPPLSYVERQVRFEFLKPRAVELDPEEEAMVREGLYGQTLHDLEQSAVSAMRLQSTRARRKAVDELVRKLRGLKYFDSRYGHIADQLAEAVRQVKVGREKDYSPSESLLVTGVFSILQDGEALAQRVEQGEELFPVAVDLDEDEPIEDDTKQESMALEETTPPESDFLSDLAIRLPESLVTGCLTQEPPILEGQDQEDDEDGEPTRGKPVETINDQAASPAGLFNW
jgi:hypothetical protein